MNPAGRQTTVIALGGNAIARFGDDGSVQSQAARARAAMAVVARIRSGGERVVLTHGNGPVVGDILIRSELARFVVPPEPLYVADADSQGGIGFLLQQELDNELRRLGSPVMAVAVVTQVVVDPRDEAFRRPTKPIGPYYTAEQAEELAARTGWVFVEEPGRGHRRVVPSPLPRRVVEAPVVRALADTGFVPIACGGGGVPVAEGEDGTLTGIDAVIDKDWSSAVLARELGAGRLVIVMEADALYDGWPGPDARRIGELSPEQTRALLPSLHPGTIGPKVAAAAWFADRGGEALLCSTEKLEAALAGESGTRIARAVRRSAT